MINITMVIASSKDLSKKIIGEIKDNTYYIKLLLIEFFEIFILFSLYSYIGEDKKYTYYRAIKISFILALLSLFLEIYNSDLKTSYKTGIVSTMGGLIKL
jgi:hypothetical protein